MMNKFNAFTLLTLLAAAHMRTYKTSVTPIQQQQMISTQITDKALTADSEILDKPKALAQFIEEMQNAHNENKKIPAKDNSVWRIMTYNVHFFKNPDNTENVMEKMVHIIKEMNPDLLILQEVAPFSRRSTSADFINSPFVELLQDKTDLRHFAGCNTVEKSFFGNIIASNTPFNIHNSLAFKEQIPGPEKRCLIYAQTILPNLQELNVYGTHLEVEPTAEETRKKQIEEITRLTQQHLADKNILIAADFNATRSKSPVEFLQSVGFVDCFTYIGWQHPQYTSWTGKEIDFIFLSPSWNLPLAGCYVYYDATSDHLPIIMDIKMDHIHKQTTIERID